MDKQCEEFCRLALAVLMMNMPELSAIFEHFGHDTSLIKESLRDVFGQEAADTTIWNTAANEMGVSPVLICSLVNVIN